MINSIENRVGLIGFGSMGPITKQMFPSSDVVAFDPGVDQTTDLGIQLVSLEEAANAGTVVFGVPARSLPDALRDVLKRRNSARGLFVDISSVQMHPVQQFERQVPSSIDILNCHPLFGPVSASKRLQGHRVLVTKSRGERSEDLLHTWTADIGLNRMDMTPEQHDKWMLGVHVLPFMVGRIVNKLGLDDPLALQTSSRLQLRKLQSLDETHSDELIDSILRFNPFAKDMIFEAGRIGLDLVGARPSSGVLDNGRANYLL